MVVQSFSFSHTLLIRWPTECFFPLHLVSACFAFGVDFNIKYKFENYHIEQKYDAIESKTSTITSAFGANSSRLIIMEESIQKENIGCLLASPSTIVEQKISSLTTILTIFSI